NLAEKITVTEEIPIVNTTLSSVSGLVSQEQVKDLPLNGRSYNDLLLLNTNVNDNRSNTGARAVSYSIGGKRLEANRWTINGMDYIGTNSDRKSTRLNSSHEWISYAVFCLKKKKP